jgi:prevent-host-death family protein
LIKVSLSELNNNLSAFVRTSRKEDVVVTVHGRPVAVIVGPRDADGRLEHRLLNDEDFLARIAGSRRQYREGDYKTLETLL